MNLDYQALKKSIIDKTVRLPLALVYDKSRFVAEEYAKAISDIYAEAGKDTVRICSIDDYADAGVWNQNQALSILAVDELNLKLIRDEMTDLLVICHKTTGDESSINVCTLPELANWNMEEYVSVHLKGFNPACAKALCENCDYDIYRISNEVSKLESLNEAEQLNAFHEMLDFGCLTGKNDVFALVDAIIDDDCFKARHSLLGSVGSTIVDPIGLLTMTMNKLLTIAKVSFDRNANAKSLGISPKYFDFIKRKYSGRITQEKIADMYLKLILLDMDAKSGLIDKNALLDYILVKVFAK